MSEFLDRAVQAHVQWKIKLITAINGGEIPNRQTACVDNCCELGKWIYADGQALSEHTEFKELQANHKKFHTSVGKVLDLVVAKKIAEAKIEISSGDFAKCSSETVRSITQLKAAALVLI